MTEPTYDDGTRDGPYPGEPENVRALADAVRELARRLDNVPCPETGYLPGTGHPLLSALDALDGAIRDAEKAGEKWEAEAA